MKTLLIALSGAALLCSGLAGAQAADLEAGKAAFEKFTCASCHGADGKTAIDPAYPVIAGQHKDYLVHALKAYQRGQSGAPSTSNVRKNAIMGAMATPLSASDIENIAGWLATLPSPLAIRK